MKVLKLLFALCFLPRLAIAGGGLVMKMSPIMSIPIAPENYTRILVGHKPDSAWAVLNTAFDVNAFAKSYFRSYRGEKMDSIILDDLFNMEAIDGQRDVGNIAFYRAVFKNEHGDIKRFITIGTEGKLNEEAALLPGGDSWEIIKYNTSGQPISRRHFRETIRRFDTTMHSDSRIWQKANPSLSMKDGLEETFYSSGKLKKTILWSMGRLVDTQDYSYYENGSRRAKFFIENGKVRATVYYNKEGEQINANVNAPVWRRLSTGDSTNMEWIQGFSNRKAFLFGADRFSHKYSHVTDVQSCSKDALGLSTALQIYQGLYDEDIESVVGTVHISQMRDAMKRFEEKICNGDQVFIHLSVPGLTYQKDSTAIPELIIPCYEFNDYSDIGIAVDSAAIRQQVFREFIKNISRRSGSTGQVFMSADMCKAGYLLSLTDTAELAAANLGLRGESAPILTALSDEDGAPVFIYTATGSANNDLAWERQDEQSGKQYGVYSLSLIRALSTPLIETTNELFEFIYTDVTQYRADQKPIYLAKKDGYLFQPDPAQEATILPTNRISEIRLTGNAFILSVGISNYNTHVNRLRFTNCLADANAYTSFFTRQFSSANYGTQFNATSLTLNNTQATKDSIIAALNRAINTTKPDDYFIFNFSGYCRPLADSGGRTETWFVPYGLNEITDEAEIRLKGISLHELRDLLQYIPARNQLFITESGPTANFQREFVQALVETSPNIGSFSSKNRFIIVPRTAGLDYFTCGGAQIQHGPINYYITHLPADLNIFGLFADSISKDAVTYALRKTDADCGYFRSDYFSIFSEADFAEDLRHYLPPEVTRMRGAQVIATQRNTINQAIGKKYALVVGTNRYAGKPNWNELANPVSDAREIGNLLRRHYGFLVTELMDTTVDGLYGAVMGYSARLQPNDQLLIYIAGHGDFDSTLFDDGFLVSSNSKALAEDPYRNTYIQYSKLSRMLNKMPARQVLVLLDVCFGGTFDERLVRKNRGDDAGYDNVSNAQFMDEQLTKTTRKFISSGSLNVVSDGYRGKHSPFAARLLEGLEAAGRAGEMLLSGDLYRYVVKLPSRPRYADFGDSDAGGEFILQANAPTITQP